MLRHFCTSESELEFNESPPRKQGCHKRQGDLFGLDFIYGIY
jgi:hypothetical protein